MEDCAHSIALPGGPTGLQSRSEILPERDAANSETQLDVLMESLSGNNPRGYFLSTNPGRLHQGPQEERERRIYPRVHPIGSQPPPDCFSILIHQANSFPKT